MSCYSGCYNIKLNMSVLFSKKTNIPKRTVVRRKSASGLLLEVNMSFTSGFIFCQNMSWNFIILNHDLFSRRRLPNVTGTSTEKIFIVRLSHTAHLYDISNLLCYVPGVTR